MEQGLLITMAQDMGCLQLLYQDQPGIAEDKILYSAMSEWLRAITLDVDPLLGSNKTGVTCEYLRYRGAYVLTGLASTLLGLHVARARAEELTVWMIDAMLKLRELWLPFPGQVMCMSDRVVDYWQGHGRVLGLRPVAPSSGIVQIGLCHYERKEAEASRIEAFRRMREDIGKLERESRTRVQFVENEEYLRLARGWPAAKEPLMWDKTQEWMMGTFPAKNETRAADRI